MTASDKAPMQCSKRLCTQQQSAFVRKSLETQLFHSQNTKVLPHIYLLFFYRTQCHTQVYKVVSVKSFFFFLEKYY